MEVFINPFLNFKITLKITIFVLNFRRCHTETTESSKCVIDIQGMKCQSCVRKITNTLNEKEGVTNVLVNLELKEGVVMYDALSISPSQIVEIVQSLGFISMLKLLK